MAKAWREPPRRQAGRGHPRRADHAERRAVEPGVARGAVTLAETMAPDGPDHEADANGAPHAANGARTARDGSPDGAVPAGGVDARRPRRGGGLRGGRRLPVLTLRALGGRLLLRGFLLRGFLLPGGGLLLLHLFLGGRLRPRLRQGQHHLGGHHFGGFLLDHFRFVGFDLLRFRFLFRLGGFGHGLLGLLFRLGLLDLLGILGLLGGLLFGGLLRDLVRLGFRRLRGFLQRLGFLHRLFLRQRFRLDGLRDGDRKRRQVDDHRLFHRVMLGQRTDIAEQIGEGAVGGQDDDARAQPQAGLPQRGAPVERDFCGFGGHGVPVWDSAALDSGIFSMPTSATLR